MNSRVKYIVRPGYIKSRHDKDLHYIPAGRLMALYRVSPNECLVVPSDQEIPEDLLHLRILSPRRDGKYDKPI